MCRWGTSPGPENYLSIPSACASGSLAEQRVEVARAVGSQERRLLGSWATWCASTFGAAGSIRAAVAISSTTRDLRYAQVFGHVHRDLHSRQHPETHRGPPPDAPDETTKLSAAAPQSDATLEKGSARP